MVADGLTGETLAACIQSSGAVYDLAIYQQQMQGFFVSSTESFCHIQFSNGKDDTSKCMEANFIYQFVKFHRQRKKLGA